MDDQALYPVYPHRNVAAAFEPFLGPDSGGVERFFASAVERECFFGRHWQSRYAALASGCGEATQELVARAYEGWSRCAELASSAADVLAALKPIAAAWWMKARFASSVTARKSLEFILCAASPQPSLLRPLAVI